MIGGATDPAFRSVRDAFERNFADHGEVGAACAVYLDGHKVVDLWGGIADPTTRRPWEADTITTVFSCTKGATAACANLLLERGLLDVDTPVAAYWPEFAANGKAAIPVRWVLSHKAGLPVIDAPLTRDDLLAWTPVVDALAAQRPVWEPGTAHGYHALTFGWLVGELVRRVTGRSIGTFFREEFGEPLDLSWWIGLPTSEEHRVAPILPQPSAGDPAEAAMVADLIPPDALVTRAMGLLKVPRDFNDPAVHRAEVPAAGGIADARSMARLYAALMGTVDGGPRRPLLSREQLEDARTCQTSGADRVISLPAIGLDIELTFGLGFMVASPWCRFGGPTAFGHNGAGGALAFGDPENRIAFGYCMNQMQQPPGGDPRSSALVRAVYEAIGVEPTFA